MLKKLLLGSLLALGLLVLLVGVLAIFAWRRTASEPLPRDSQSAARVGSGPHEVGRVEFDWVDRSRSTPPSESFGGASERPLPTTLWFPENAPSNHPLVVYSHGFLSSRRGGTFLAEHLASHGYVVVAADHPLTTPAAPGAPDPRDVVNQPEDVSFLIDRVLGLTDSEKPFEGAIDRQRIGVFGLSLGGLTSTLVAFHPEMRDPRVAAAISIAGPTDVFGPRFYERAAVPFLMIGGTADRIIDYTNNALVVPERAPTGALLTLEGGTHIGFDQVATGFFRVFGDPDAFVCRGAALAGDSAPDPNENIFVGLFGDADLGLVEPESFTPACSESYDEVLKSGRQHELTKLAVLAFFESQFASEPSARAAHARFLVQTMPSEIPEVSYTSSGRRTQSVEAAG